MFMHGNIFTFNFGDFYALFPSIKQCKECRYGYMLDQRQNANMQRVDPKPRKYKITKCG